MTPPHTPVPTTTDLRGRRVKLNDPRRGCKTCGPWLGVLEDPLTGFIKVQVPAGMTRWESKAAVSAVDPPLL